MEMIGDILRDQASKLPDLPGVYLFKRGQEILYVGKATSLRDRVRSYLSGDLARTRGSWLSKMIETAEKIDYRSTHSVLEALVLEAELIKKYQPPYNAREKDDRSFNYLVFTQEEFPRVLVVRGRQLAKPATGKGKLAATFGPFPHGGELKEALKLLRRIFPFRDKCLPLSKSAGRGRLPRECFNAQLGLCPGVCSGAIGAREYRRRLGYLKMFLRGKTAAVVKGLEREMAAAARAQNFERAAQVRKQIYALQHIQDVGLLKREIKSDGSAVGEFRIEAYDIAHTSGQSTVGVMTVVLGGERAPDHYRLFRLRGRKKDQPDDTANLGEVISRRLNHPEWPFPDLVVVDGGKAQVNLAAQIISGLGLATPVVGVVKDERHKPRDFIGDRLAIGDYHREILLANAEAHRFALSYHRRIRGKIPH